MRLGKGAERGRLVAVGLDVTVRHRPRGGDPVGDAGQHVRGGVEASEVERAGRRHRSLGAVGAARAEVDQRPPRRRLDDTRGLRGEHCLQMHLVEDVGLDELGDRQWRLDPQQRLVGEDGRALGHRIDIALEAQRGEPAEVVGAEHAECLELAERLVSEVQPLEIVEHVFDPAGDEVAALGRQRPDREVEDGATRKPVLAIGAEHRQLVEIGEERLLVRLHYAVLSTRATPAALSSSRRRAESPGSRSTPRMASVSTVVPKPRRAASRALPWTQ